MSNNSEILSFFRDVKKGEDALPMEMEGKRFDIGGKTFAIQLSVGLRRKKVYDDLCSEIIQWESFLNAAKISVEATQQLGSLSIKQLQDLNIESFKNIYTKAADAYDAMQIINIKAADFFENDTKLSLLFINEVGEDSAKWSNAIYQQKLDFLMDHSKPGDLDDVFFSSFADSLVKRWLTLKGFDFHNCTIKRIKQD